MLDILCVGDAVLDIFLQIPEDDPHFNLDKEKNKINIDLGFKINIENYIKEIGGNSCNTSVGISRLGKLAGLCAEIGQDEFSNLIINKLTKEAVNTSFITQNPNKKTSFSISINFKGERTLLVEHVERPHMFNFDSTSAKYIYLSSLGKIWENAYQTTLNFIKTTDSKLAFNPGTLQIKEKNQLIFDLISNTDYLFLNKEEAQKILYSKDTDLTDEKDDIKKIIYGLKSLGPKNIIVTDSFNGSYTQDESGNIYHLGVVKVDMVEATGAGDSYTSGFLSAILYGKSIKDAMIWGAVNASSVVQKVGAQEGLLNKEQLDEKIATLGNFYPQQI